MIKNNLILIRLSALVMYVLLSGCSEDIDCIQYGWKYESIQNTWFMDVDGGSPIKVANFDLLSGEINFDGHYYQGN